MAVFHDQIDCPFQGDEICRAAKDTPIILVTCNASDKRVAGHGLVLDGRVSAVVGPTVTCRPPTSASCRAAPPTSPTWAYGPRKRHRRGPRHHPAASSADAGALRARACPGPARRRDRDRAETVAPRTSAAAVPRDPLRQARPGAVLTSQGRRRSDCAGARVRRPSAVVLIAGPASQVYVRGNEARADSVASPRATRSTAGHRPARADGPVRA